MFLEDAAEIQGIIIANDAGDLIDVVVCSFQQTDGVVDSYGEYVLHGGFCRQLFEIPQEPADRHASGFGVLFDVNFFIIMLSEIAPGKLHFILNEGTDSGVMLFSASYNQKQDLPQIHFQQFLISDPAGLELVDHFLKQVCIHGGIAGVEDRLIHGHAIVLEDVFNVAAGKVNPVYLGFVLGEVFVVLRLTRLKENHLFSVDDALLVSKIEMGFAGGNVDQLIIQRAAGSPGRQFFFGLEAVVSAAAYDEGFGLILERESVVVEETGVHVHNANLHSHSACWISCKTMDSNVSFAATLTIF